MVLFPGVKSQACGSVAVQCWVAGSAPRLNPTHCYTTLEKKKTHLTFSLLPESKMEHGFEILLELWTAEPAFPKPGSSYHHAPVPGPTLSCSGQSSQPGRLCLPLCSKLLLSSGLLLILWQLGGWLWVGYEDSESNKRYWLLMLRDSGCMR